MRQSSFNWKYALGEIALIFIGISLSLMFDQWRTTRSNEAKERELLILLRESVKNDVNGLMHQMNESNKTLNAIDYLLRKLNNKGSQFNDSLSRAFSYMTYNPQFNPDKTGYDNILATGLSVISDNDLRKVIIEYYARVENNVAWGAGVQKHLDEYLSPRVITDFEDYEFQDRGIPFDFQKMKSDRIFINVLKKSKRLNVVSLDRLKSQKDHAEAFLKTLDR
jgi:hypothetical protein